MCTCAPRLKSHRVRLIFCPVLAVRSQGVLAEPHLVLSVTSDDRKPLATLGFTYSECLHDLAEGETTVGRGKGKKKKRQKG